MVEQHCLTRIYHEPDCDWFARRAANPENYRRIDGPPDDGRHCMKCDRASDRTAHDSPLPSLEEALRGLAIAGAVVTVTKAVAWAKRMKVRRSRRARSEAVSAAADSAYEGVPPVMYPVDPARSVPTAPPGVASRHVVPPVRRGHPCVDQSSSARLLALNAGNRRTASRGSL